MTVLDTLNFVVLNPLYNNPIAVRRRKLITKINEKIQVYTNKVYTPIQPMCITYNDIKKRKVEVTKRLKRWWTASVDEKINLVVRNGGKPLEFANGKSTIELATEAEVAHVSPKVRDFAELVELVARIERQVQFGGGMTIKNK